MASAASAAGSAETRVEFRIDMHSLCNFHEKRARDQLTNILKALDDVPAHHKTIEDSIIVFGEVATPAAASLLFARCTPHWGPQVGDKRVCHVYEYVKTKSHIKKGPPDGFCIIQSADVWWVRQCPDEGSLLWDVNCVILQHRRSPTMVVAVHLSTNEKKIKDSVQQLKDFVKQCKRRDIPVICLGDFNFGSAAATWGRLGFDHHVGVQMFVGHAHSRSEKHYGGNFHSEPNQYTKTCRVNSGVVWTSNGGLHMEGRVQTVGAAEVRMKTVSGNDWSEEQRKANRAAAKAARSDHVGLSTRWSAPSVDAATQQPPR